ncbi:MAG TPA: ABC transporter ATP-binding protein [Nitrososphaerales archaeon]|nr:ABC transporter ATP-binding protein [Nitrososphaerales archaeon]
MAYPAGKSQADTILEIEKLRKMHVSHVLGAKEQLTVIDDVSFGVKEGEFVTIIGPSGCGKSTLLNIVAGLEPYDSGDIVVRGHRIGGAGPDIIMVFQEDSLFPWLTVQGNVEFGLEQKGLSKQERKRIASEYIELVDLEQFADAQVHQLSGGMKQRAAIARALALNPRILLMDEPFGALDARTRQILQNEIQKIHEKTKKTILFVTHDVREAVSLGDRVIVFTRRPAQIKQQYIVDLPRPRDSEDPALIGLINSIMREIKEETIPIDGETKKDTRDRVELTA